MATHRFLVYVGLLCLAALPVASQTPTQTPAMGIVLHGVVTDENGLAVGGATIRLHEAASSASVNSGWAVISNAAGEFRFAAVPGGSYIIEMDKPGFFHFTSPNPISIDTEAPVLQLRLTHAQEIHQVVEVTSSANPIDTQATTPEKSLQVQEIRDLPLSDTYDLSHALVALPGVMTDNGGGLHVAGARSNQTLYLLDGFEIGDPANGALDGRLNVDAVRSADVEYGALGADKANAGSGRVALETQMGDDRFRTSATDFLPTVLLNQGLHLGTWYPRFSFSGPIARGRAWFSESVSLQHTFTLINGLARGSNTTQLWQGDSLTHFQFNVSKNNELRADSLVNAGDNSHLGLNVLAPLSTTTDQHSQRTFYSVLDQWTPGNALIQIGAAFDQGRISVLPLGSEAYVLQPQGVSGDYFQTLHRQSGRDQWLANVTLPEGAALSHHTLRFGGDIQWLQVSQQAQRGLFEIESAGGTLLQQTSFEGFGAWSVSPHIAGGYVDDSWKVSSRWLIDSGLRLDAESLAAHSVLQPRVSASYLPFGSDRGKLSFGWGIAFQPVDLTVYGQALDQTREDSYYDEAGNFTTSTITRFQLPAQRLPAPRLFNSNVSWQQRFGNRTFLTISALRRNQRDGWVYTAPILASDPFLLQNLRRDEYQSEEISLRHTFHDQTELFGDYTRSSARSNQVLDYSLLSPVFSPQASGPLTWDAPNRFLTWGWTHIRFQGLLLSYLAEYRTGFPFSVVNQLQQLVGAPGSQRFPAYERLDLGVERQVTLLRYVWGVRVAAVNSLGRFNPTAVVNNTGAANFLTFEGSQGRAFTARVRLVGREASVR